MLNVKVEDKHDIQNEAFLESPTLSCIQMLLQKKKGQ